MVTFSGYAAPGLEKNFFAFWVDCYILPDITPKEILAFT